METEVLIKNNPTIEATKRINMSYLLLTNPKIVEIMQETGSNFFHGTNANALPSILKYGINSVDKSQENSIEVTTGEERSRIQGKRKFASVTDCLDIALDYAKITPNNENTKESLLNFGVIIGISLQNMKGIQSLGIKSDLPEVGIIGNLPLDNIKFLSVPKDKEEFVKKLIGKQDIEVISMDLNDIFYKLDFSRKLEILNQTIRKDEYTKSDSPTFTKPDIKKVLQKRKLSKIKEIYNNLRNSLKKQTNDKQIEERG